MKLNSFAFNSWLFTSFVQKPHNLFVLSVKGFLAQENIFISLNLYALVSLEKMVGITLSLRYDKRLKLELYEQW